MNVGDRVVIFSSSHFAGETGTLVKISFHNILQYEVLFDDQPEIGPVPFMLTELSLRDAPVDPTA